MTYDKPAILGNDPEFTKPVPIIKPSLDQYKDQIATKIDVMDGPTYARYTNETTLLADFNAL